MSELTAAEAIQAQADEQRRQAEEVIAEQAAQGPRVETQEEYAERVAAARAVGIFDDHGVRPVTIGYIEEPVADEVEAEVVTDPVVEEPVEPVEEPVEPTPEPESETVEEPVVEETPEEESAEGQESGAEVTPEEGGVEEATGDDEESNA